MKLFKLSITVGVFVFLFCTSLLSIGQTFDDFKKQVDDDFSDFREKTIQSFNDHIEKIDKEFADYLVSSFGEHALDQFKAVPKPKPDSPPKYSNQAVPETDKINLTETPPPFKSDGVVLPLIKKQEPVSFETRKINFDFFGSEIETVYDKRMVLPNNKSWSPDMIAGYWTELSATNYNHLIEQFRFYQQNLNLNDWAYYQLINRFTFTVYPENSDMRNLLSWFLLTRSGYKTRIAYDENGVYLLLSSTLPIQGNFVRFDNVNYYLINDGVEKLQTYEKDTPQADRIFDLSVASPVNLGINKVNKQFQFRFSGQKHTVDLSYNKNLIDLYKTMPLADIRIYFNSLAGPVTKTSIRDAFEPLIKDLSETEAANLLLSFVQQAFIYKTDQEAYGAEKYLFPDELLHYPFADCEDRAVFYAYLVKTLLKLDVAGIDFPGHMATAINFQNNPPGEYIQWGNKKYVIADPTFIGAPLGLLMPDINKSEANLIEIKSNLVNRNMAEKLWKTIRSYGGYKSDVLQDIVFAPSGNAYVCGYFVKEADFAGKKISSDFEGRDLFVAKFDSDLHPVWVKAATGPGNDMSYSLALDPKGILYVYGTVEQSLNFGGNSISAINSPDVFVARYGPNGDVRWVTKAGIDKLDHQSDFMFSASFNPSGDKIGARLFNETKDFDHYGLYLDGNGNAMITGSFYATTGLSSANLKNYNTDFDFNIPIAMVDTNNRLLKKYYEPTIAGLFAAIKIIQLNSIEVQGDAVQKALNKNESFINQAKKIYNNFGILSFILNKSGIVVINTANKETVDFGFIRVYDNARIKIVPYQDGNSKIDVLSGICVADPSGNAQFDINSISLFKDSGDLLLDYDNDHTKYKLNLRSDLLHLN